MTLKQRIKFYRQLAALVRGGVPIRGSLQRLAERMPEAEVRTLAHEIEQGNPLGPAFATAKFSPFESRLVAAGERSAQLDLVFERLAEFWERELRFAQSVKRQLVYPVVLLHFSVIVLAVSRIAQGVYAVLDTLIFGFVALYVTGFALYMIARVAWSSESTRALLLRTPLIGGALRTSYAYRWITALRMEFSAGVSLPDAVSDAWLASGYLEAETHAAEGERGLRSGEELSRLVARWRQLPRDWVDFVETGELSGEYESMFTNMEKEAAHNWTVAQQRMSEWVPKILSFAVLLLVAGFIAYQMYALTIAPIEQVEKAIDNP
jgi:type II secretory pathway component PulF